MSNLLLSLSDGFKISCDEQVDQDVPFFVLLKLTSKDTNFTGKHPEDSCDRLGNSVVARDDNINEFKGSISVAKCDGWDVDV